MASARCVYCGSTLEPNSRYCLECGQLVFGRPEHDEIDEGWEPRPRPRRDEPPAASGAAPAGGERAPEPEGRTMLRSRAQRRGWPERVALRFSTGASAVVGGAAVIGRRPEQTAANMGAQSIEIDDATRSVSRVHLYLTLDGGRLLVGDAGSSNGSSIERGDRTIPLEAGGERTEVLPGDAVWIGNVRIEISPA